MNGAQCLAVVILVVSLIKASQSCSPANSPCQLNFAEYTQSSSDFQLSPQPECNGLVCNLDHDTDYTLNVGDAQACDGWYSQWSTINSQGGDVDTVLTGDLFHTRLAGKCIGYGTEAWWGTGFWEAPDYDPRSFVMNCQNGVLTGALTASRRPFYRRILSNPAADGPPSIVFTAAVTGFDTLQCGPCIDRSNNLAVPPVTLESGQFTETGGNGNCDSAANPTTCELPPGTTQAVGQSTTIVYSGSCTNNIARITGRQLEYASGFAAQTFPNGFHQFYQGQGICIALDFTGNSALSQGFTLVNIQDDTIEIWNDRGISSWCMTASNEISGTPVYTCVGGGERIECGSCPTTA